MSKDYGGLFSAMSTHKCLHHLLMKLCTVEDEIFKLFTISHWEKLFWNCSKVCRHLRDPSSLRCSFTTLSCYFFQPFLAPVPTFLRPVAAANSRSTNIFHKLATYFQCLICFPCSIRNEILVYGIHKSLYSVLIAFHNQHFFKLRL